jgi:aminopeptidase N
VTLRADKGRYPVLLSNGNLVEQRHRWTMAATSPAGWTRTRKPCLPVRPGGRPVGVRGSSASPPATGQEHLLQVYVRPGDLDKTEHAMNSLMASASPGTKPDSACRLDLERFMIVATSDFNMGAMENKGLNIFNTKFVLASQATATDTDYANVESVVGHEYFHNWTGNRVTCRDWFQLSLKEGLTVFRDQEFSQDLCRRPVGPRRQAHRGCAGAAHRAVPRGCRPHGPPGAPRQLHRDQQLLHRHHLREGC